MQNTETPPGPSTDTLLDWALWYVRLGWPVLPLRPRGKTPITEHGLKDATTDEAQVRTWWQQNPTANIGIRTGPESGLLVLDVDVKSYGIETYEDLINLHGALPHTLESHTGGGGRHHLFAYPDGSIGNSAGRVGPGIDVRGEGGYFVAPPSLHESGRAYEWEVSSSPDQVPPAVVPDWLLDAIQGESGRNNGKPIQDCSLIPVGTRNDTLFRIGCSLRERFGCIEEEIENLLRAMNGGRCVDAQGNPAPLPDAEIRAIARSITEHYPCGPDHIPAPKDGGKPKAKAVSGKDQGQRPEIRMRGGHLPAIVDQAEAALLQSQGDDLYQRGGILVRPIRLDDPTSSRGVKRRRRSLVIHVIERPNLVERMTQAAAWKRFDTRSEKWIAVDCPERIAKVYMARAGSWRVPPLLGIIEAPTLRSDGSILIAPGYDQETGLFFDPGGVDFSPIPEQPTHDDAEAALALLLDLLEGFPFVAQSDRSTAVSAILSSLIRKSIKTAPLHAFRAPKMRSGKTLLADCASLFATGRPCAVMSQSLNPEEERKRLLAVLLAGDPVVCYDNIDRPFGGAAICQALTQESITDRLLGVSKTVTAPTSCLFLATGNNLVFEGDITSRVIPCDIDPECEKPEERSFQRNLYDYIPAHREWLVPAALTILRAFHVAGRPNLGLRRWGGFEEWSEWVRGAIVWLGMADPVEGRQRIENTDPHRCNLLSLLTAWYEIWGVNPTTAGDVVKVSQDFGNEPLRTVLGEMATNRRGEINSRTLGKFLSANEKRIEGGLRFERAGSHQRAVLWRVVAMEEP